MFESSHAFALSLNWHSVLSGELKVAARRAQLKVIFLFISLVCLLFDYHIIVTFGKAIVHFLGECQLSLVVGSIVCLLWL